VTTPGLMLFARYGHPIRCRILNQLPYVPSGFGTHATTTLLHHVHTPSESDGFPGDRYSLQPAQQGPTRSDLGEFQITSTPTSWRATTSSVASAIRTKHCGLAGSLSM